MISWRKRQKLLISGEISHVSLSKRNFFNKFYESHLAEMKRAVFWGKKKKLNSFSFSNYTIIDKSKFKV